jgi:hypothetical protein
LKWFSNPWNSNNEQLLWIYTYFILQYTICELPTLIQKFYVFSGFCGSYLSLQGFENHFHSCGNTHNHTPQIKRPKRNLNASGKCPCCNLKTDSENGEEQTKTILTHFLRDIVPKFSRITCFQVFVGVTFPLMWTKVSISCKDQRKWHIFSPYSV